MRACRIGLGDVGGGERGRRPKKGVSGSFGGRYCRGVCNSFVKRSGMSDQEIFARLLHAVEQRGRRHTEG
jgi:hypothetical protein